MTKKTIIIFLSVIVILSGCTVSSGPKQFVDEQVGEILAEDELAEIETIVSLEDAIMQTQSDLVEQFWFRSHIANNIEKRKNTYMTVDGIVVRPHGYYMRNTLVTQPYEYYRWDDEVFLRQNDNWFRGREPELPFDIFYGFDRWNPLLDRAEVLRTDNVLGIPAIVHEIKLSGDELYALDQSIVEQLPLSETDHLANVLENTNARVLFYIGDITKSRDDREILPIIYKYQILLEIPIPGAGYMKQEIQHFIFRVNMDNIEMPSIEEIEKYVIEIEDAQEMMELEEQEEPEVTEE